ncbi:DNA-directed RNA polymerase V subunit 1 isoform X1 [Vicia villosa]|uniref:DNA-directed RNA polymerase V subunit 1 isoform X1 n=1 Tax=Vicia villosa TaxID=3911 RepID=UPI00273CBE9D|nr:DNA-directed RNA polymerase V subunit 1 isoform X1 [Vicia villosa]XP_058765598.1 DNA-directed RNA polymerase V subunit 1 isoform X1 [Vicia villosa]XP_058765599.1 DNA-directed RNA polymerase V subunit 1 isoform X1 [Vicia villosa]
MEDNPASSLMEGKVVGIRFSMATRQEISTASISDSQISHASQLGNPFLGLPLEFGRCESCGTSEAGKCEGHFGYIELPVPIYHPSHVTELKRILSLVCLNCLKLKKTKIPSSGSGFAQRVVAPCCEDISAPQVSIQEIKTADGACYLALKVAKSKMSDGFWSFLEKYGYRYEGDHTRALLPCEVMEIIKRMPQETKKKLAGKGYFPQDGYVVKYLPVPPNCLSVPVVSDGVSIMSSDPSMTVLRKLLRKVEVIRSSRSGEPNFESHLVEANDLQSVVDQYLQIRGTSKAARDIETHYAVNKELNESSTKAWLEKMRTLFIKKGSGFSSRNVITGDGYKKINEVGIPLEVAQRITFEERVSIHNIHYLQKLVDENLCLTYKEGLSTYSLREGSKGHTYLKPGQIVHRRIMDGDVVFINRPPTTHKHSLQALVVYIHDDHTVKINPLICGPLGADFDGDCVHLFYPQSLAAKAEVLELFSVEKQLLSSHSGNLNLQLSADSLLSLKMLVKSCFLDKATANQMAMLLSLPLPMPALLNAGSGDSYWTSIQMLQCALPFSFDCTGGRYLIRQREILEFDFTRDVLPSIINEIAASIFFSKGPPEALNFFDVIQPFLMENIFAYGFSVGLQDLSISRAVKRVINRSIGKVSPLLNQLRVIYKEPVAQQLEKHIQDIELPVINFALKSTKLGDLIDSKSKSAVDKVVQQIGFLGQQLFERGKFYSKGLVADVASLFHVKCFYDGDGYPSAEFGLLKGCFFHGLDPYEEFVHSIATREITDRSSRGLSEPGTLFKNLMAILRDVVICYDGTVRNVCSNSIIQFEYGNQSGEAAQHLFPAGEPVGVLAATSMSNPAYKAVLDASPNSNSSWEFMKEILVCKVNFRNEPNDRRLILYLNDCDCGRSYCRENAAYLVKNQLRKVSLKDAALDFIVEYQQQRRRNNAPEDAGLVGHIHLDEAMLEKLKISMIDVYQKCQERLNSFSRKKKLFSFFKRTELFFSESCSSPNYSAPCVTFVWLDGNDLDQTTKVLADLICPALLDTIIQGDPRISSANIIWVNPGSNTWVRNPSKTSNGELALDVILEKEAVKQSGDAWRIVLDSCLPVLHLIDTRRSVTYAIKQIQELLGISCTFDQVIQRLAASVRMVAKGVLREHLILLASSMTCGGNLVGFNIGGYKTLARQLNIQVPFTDATLFTPKKCFERAAEKHHADSLSSIVASCSWGKHVAVGTGSRFDIVWDPKETNTNEIEGMDVYKFLHMVKGLANGEEENNACLGEDIDDLPDDENVDGDMSPPHTSGFDAVFDETFELVNGSASNGWDSSKDQTDQIKTNTNDWSDWGQNKSEIQVDGAENNQWNSGTHQEDASKSSAWGVGTNQEDASKSNAWGAGTNIKDSSKSSAWGAGTNQEDSSKSSAWGAGTNQEDASKSSAWEAGTTIKDSSKSSAWGAGTNQEDSSKSSAWGTGTNQEDASKSNAWGAGTIIKDSSKSSAWGGGTNQEDFSKSSAWGAGTNQKSDQSSWGKSKSDGPQNAEWESGSSQKWKSDVIQEDSTKSGAWGANTNKNQNSDQSSWGKKKSGIQYDGAEKAKWESGSSQKWKADVIQEDSTKSGAWGANTNQNSDQSSWGKKKSGIQGDDEAEKAKWESGSSQKWKASVAQDDSSKSGAWGANTNQINDQSSWGRNKSGVQDGGEGWAQGEAGGIQKDSSNSGDWKTWGKSKPEDSPKSSAWGANKDATKPKSNDMSSWGMKKDEVHVMAEDSSNAWDNQPWDSKNGSNSSWGKSKAQENPPWNSKNESNQAASSRGWDSQAANANSENDKSFQWGKQGRESFKKNRFEGSQGWGPNTGDWKNKSRARPPGQRFELYSSEEQDVLKDIEPIFQSIRRIMQQQGYNDGDPLPADDQKYVLENVFEHHPDKETKMGGGIDHVMVSKHSEFQDTRCLYLVLKDGKKEDFSYRKCLENLVRKKYPDTAESFCGKYFKKPQPFELYTSEEQDVLKDIGPIVQSIRRIMQQQGYNDGDPLPSDDQKYVLENVFEHHPDKETKMGGGIDHVMVSKHSEFQDSRCLYVVLKDGKKEDFSYRKCLENFVRKKYPDIAESFCGKYFKKPQPRVKRDLTPNPVGEQTSNPTPAGEQPATLNPAEEQTSIPNSAGEQTATPAGDQTSTPMPIETNE